MSESTLFLLFIGAMGASALGVFVLIVWSGIREADAVNRLCDELQREARERIAARKAGGGL